MCVAMRRRVMGDNMETHASTNPSIPRFVVLEGVDGSGKTTLARALTHYYAATKPERALYSGSFPGSEPGTLGAWVYRIHHDQAGDAPAAATIAPPALQLLHVAAHVGTILRRIAPTLARDGSMILDRYWWSTYAYARRHLPHDDVWRIVDAERPFWRGLPAPVVIYLTRRVSLKVREIDAGMHVALDAAYREVIVAEREGGVRVHELPNDGPLAQTWAALLDALGVPYRAMGVNR